MEEKVVVVNTSSLEAIANSIREKLGSEKKLTLQEMSNIPDIAKGLVEDNMSNVVIPEGVTKLRDFLFYNFASLHNITLPSTLTTLETGCIRGCKNIATMIFKSTPQIHSTAFNGSEIVNMYVPWEDGAVAGYPWGARIENIHYGSVV